MLPAEASANAAIASVGGATHAVEAERPPNTTQSNRIDTILGPGCWTKDDCICTPQQVPNWHTGRGCNSLVLHLLASQVLEAPDLQSVLLLLHLPALRLPLPAPLSRVIHPPDCALWHPGMPPYPVCPRFLHDSHISSLSIQLVSVSLGVCATAPPCLAMIMLWLPCAPSEENASIAQIGCDSLLSSLPRLNGCEFWWAAITNSQIITGVTQDTPDNEEL